MMRCCFDNRVCIGLGLVATGPLVIDPCAGRVALRMPAGLTGPLSMLVMTRGMRLGAPCAREPDGRGQARADRADDIPWLRREVELLIYHAGEPGAPKIDEQAAGAGPPGTLALALALPQRDGDHGRAG